MQAHDRYSALVCRESGKTRFVREASALNLPEYQVYKDQLARVYTEAVFASQAGALQRPRLAQYGWIAGCHSATALRAQTALCLLSSVQLGKAGLGRTRYAQCSTRSIMGQCACTASPPVHARSPLQAQGGRLAVSLCVLCRVCTACVESA